MTRLTNSVIMSFSLLDKDDIMSSKGMFVQVLHAVKVCLLCSTKNIYNFNHVITVM